MAGPFPLGALGQHPEQRLRHMALSDTPGFGNRTARLTLLRWSIWSSWRSRLPGFRRISWAGPDTADLPLGRKLPVNETGRPVHGLHNCVCFLRISNRLLGPLRGLALTRC
jgi:hypothetical protein